MYPPGMFPSLLKPLIKTDYLISAFIWKKHALHHLYFESGIGYSSSKYLAHMKTELEIFKNFN